MKAVRSFSDGNAADRELLIAYLEYAVSDVAAVDAMSASLLELAIAHLKEARRTGQLALCDRKLC